MIGDVILHEGRNEIVVVVVTAMPTQGQRLLGSPASGFELMRQQFGIQELIVQALIDQDALWEWRFVDQS